MTTRKLAQERERAPASVSVIMPVFNAAQHLAEAIDSVRRQTFESWELIIVDDGSTDDSRVVAQTAAQEDPHRIHFYTHSDGRNRGVSATRNLALTRSRGEFVAFLDADDVWLPEKLERQVSMLEQAPSDTVIAFSAAMRIDDHGHPLAGTPLGEGPPQTAWTYGDFLQGDVDAPTLTVVLRSQVLDDIGGFPLGLSYQVEDFITWARAMKRGRALFIDFIAAAYRVHHNSATGGLSALQRIEARNEGLCRIADTEGFDGDVALAMARLAKAALSDRSSPMRERLKLAGSITKELAKRGGLTRELGSSMIRRRLKRPLHQKRRGDHSPSDGSDHD